MVVYLDQDQIQRMRSSLSGSWVIAGTLWIEDLMLMATSSLYEGQS